MEKNHEIVFSGNDTIKGEHLHETGSNQANGKVKGQALEKTHRVQTVACRKRILV